MRRLTLDYLKTESGSGLVLAAVAVAALGVANSRLGPDYFAVLAHPVPVQIGGFAETETVAAWIRTLLMPVFFLVLGMELKFELLRGELHNLRGLAAPALAALGGLVVPVAIYFAVTRSASPWTWAAGAATDGAAALAALSLAGPRMPHALRVLVMSVALADNLAATALAAVLTDAPFHPVQLAAAGAVLALLAALSLWRRAPFLFYAAGFALVWGLTLKSGVDPALAGIACALTVPIGPRRAGQESALKYFMESLHPYVAFAVLPLFVFSAAGVRFEGMAPGDLIAPAPLGVALALVAGKPLGVLGVCGGAIALKLIRKPSGASWGELAGAALICGAGFTVSYFLAEIDPRALAAAAAPAVRADIFLASALAAAAGVAVLSLTRRAPAEPD
jgi:NhaA family Na+:H+ antiporter